MTCYFAQLIKLLSYLPQTFHLNFRHDIPSLMWPNVIKQCDSLPNLSHLKKQISYPWFYIFGMKYAGFVTQSSSWELLQTTSTYSINLQILISIFLSTNVFIVFISTYINAKDLTVQYCMYFRASSSFIYILIWDRLTSQNEFLSHLNDTNIQIFVAIYLNPPPTKKKKTVMKKVKCWF